MQILPSNVTEASTSLVIETINKFVHLIIASGWFTNAMSAPTSSGCTSSLIKSSHACTTSSPSSFPEGKNRRHPNLQLPLQSRPVMTVLALIKLSCVDMLWLMYTPRVSLELPNLRGHPVQNYPSGYPGTAVQRNHMYPQHTSRKLITNQHNH
jgi:hypothetical protein